MAFNLGNIDFHGLRAHKLTSVWNITNVNDSGTRAFFRLRSDECVQLIWVVTRWILSIAYAGEYLRMVEA